MRAVAKKDDNFEELLSKVKQEKEELKQMVEKTEDGGDKKKPKHLIHTPGFIIGYIIMSMIVVSGIVLHLKGYF